MKNILGPKLPILLDIIKNYKPNTYIEIGIFQLYTFSQIYNLINKSFYTYMYGFDLFESAPDYEIPPLDGPPISLKKANNITSKWNCNTKLFKGDTKNTLKSLYNENIIEPVCAFVDGGHSYDTVKSDIYTLLDVLKDKRGCIIMDDYVMEAPLKVLEELKGDYDISYPGYSLCIINLKKEF